MTNRTEPGQPGRRSLRRGIGAKLALLTAALLAVLVVSSAVLADQTRSTAREYDALLAQQVQQGLAARQMQVEFKKQVQEWKDILLRGFNAADLTDYIGKFHAEDATVDRLNQNLLGKVTDPQAHAQLVRFQDAHRQLDADYERALSTFAAGNGKDPRSADRAVRGLDRPPTDLLDGVVTQLETAIADRVARQEAATASRQRTTLIAGGAVLLLVIAVLVLAVLNIVRPIRRLTREANRTATERLPAAIAAIKQQEAGAPPPVLPAFRSGTQDELSDLGEALNSLQDSALRQAVDQHRADRETADMLINLGRRNQNLLGRMLAQVTELERREQDPNALSELFRLDHAATRVRRNAESMLVLAGATQTRTWSRPVPCVDVVRAALSEIEEYTRVDLHHIEDSAVNGTAVADVVHLIAELVENATHFSPPSTQVTVVGQQIREGYRIRVIDQGVGMTRQELDNANQRIRSTDSSWSDAKLLGLYVVGRLARRRGIEVTLEPSAGRGITASILLPTLVLASDAERQVPRPGRPADAGQPDSQAFGQQPAAATWPQPASPGQPAPSLQAPSQPGSPVRTADPVPAALSTVPPQSSQPTPSQPAPFQPAPFQPAPFQPAPFQSAPLQPASSAQRSTLPEPVPTAATVIDLTAAQGWVEAPTGSPVAPVPARGPAAVPGTNGAVPRRVRGAQLPDLGPAAEPVIAQVERPPAAPESLRWQLRSFQLDVEAARRAIADAGEAASVPDPISPRPEEDR